MESHESTRPRVESSLFTKHEDRIAGKGFTSMTHYNLVHNFTPMLRAMQIPDAKAAGGQGMEKLETIPAWQLENVKSKKVVSWAQKKKREESPFFHIDRHVGRDVLRGDIVKDDSGVAVFSEQGSTCVTMFATRVMDVIARQPDCDDKNKTTRVRRTSN